VDKKAWIIFGAVVVVLFGSLIAYNQSTKVNVDVSKVDVNKILPASAANGNIADHVEGSASGKVTLIEYGDFECPYCGQVYPQLKSIMATYGDNVTLIFRNFPLSTIHPNALAAAAVAEAAGQQGKYWEMHDLLYTNQSDWQSLTGDALTNVFKGYANNLKLDITKYDTALTSKDITQKVAFDRALGAKLNVQSTPSIYLDGTLISTDTNQDLEQGTGSKLMSQLDAKLKAAGLPVPTATTTTTTN